MPESTILIPPTLPATAPPILQRRRPHPWGDVLFRALALSAGGLSLVLLAAVLIALVRGSELSLDAFGASFLWSAAWNPAAGDYGALSSLAGTLITTLLALLLAVPLALAVAIFLVELAPPALARPVGLAIELTETTDPLRLSALVELGLVLFVLTFSIQALAQLWLRQLERRAAGDLATLAALAGILTLLWILGVVIQKGHGALDAAFFTELPADPGSGHGGLAGAILGTLLLTGVATLVGGPLGRTSRPGAAIRFAVNVLLGLPPILVGLFVWTILVVPAPGTDLLELRRRVSMIFPRPATFPASVFENVAYGLRMHFRLTRAELAEQVEQALRATALWGEVKDGLSRPGVALSSGQQQRLCIARALAVRPEVLLMDEPTSGVDPVATSEIEELIEELKQKVTIVLATQSMQQAARVSDVTAFFLEGRVIEVGPTRQLFTKPAQRQTEDYLTGRFG